jgi:hypothetical protein
MTLSPLAETYRCPTCDAPLGDLVVSREIADSAQLRALHYEQTQGELRMRLMDAESEVRHWKQACEDVCADRDDIVQRLAEHIDLSPNELVADE